jgi:hypothetical protein
MRQLRAVLVLLAACCGCGQQSGGERTGVVPPPDAGTPDAGTPPPPAIDVYKELVIVDSSVVLDSRASNAADGAWSFRRTVERLTPAGTTAPAFVEAWLRSFRGADVAGRAVDDRSGVERLLASWPRTGDGSLELARAPFRLVAIAGRLDLITSPNGEGRFVYGLVDPVTGAADLMTVVFEYALPPLGTANDRQAWAARWHALASHSFGGDYNVALAMLTDTFATSSALAQVRTNEAAFGSPWELREWKLASDGLRPTWTAENPDQTSNGSGALAQFILDHEADVRAGRAHLPNEMLAGTALETGAWRFPNESRIDESLRHAFGMQTCNGCHSTETFSAQGFFHINPLRPIVPGGDGHDRLSEFLRGPELRRRADHLSALLTGATADGTGAPTDLPPIPADAPHYDVLKIPAPEDGAPVAINSGRVLGNSAANGPWIHDGSIRYLLAGDARAPVAQGFNSRGDVVGYFSAGGARRAFVLSGGAVRELGTLGGGDSAATLVNDAGLIAGDSTVPAGTHHGFVVRGALQDFGGFSSGETFPFAISPGGLITGESQLDAQVFVSHAFVWSPAGGAMRDAGTLGGLYSRGQAVDDSGLIAGFSTLVPSDEKVHAFTWDGITITDLGSSPGFPWSAVTGRNAAGTMVGNIYDVPSPTAKIFEIHAFVYARNTIVDLNSVAQSPLVLRTALGIDDAGRILCTDGQVGDVRAHGLLLTPR